MVAFVQKNFQSKMNSFKVNINVCRVCLKSQAGTSMHKDNVLLENFREVTQLKINENDGLPSILCTSCTVRLKIAHEFRTQALTTDHQLRTYFNKINNESKIVATLNAPDPLNVSNKTELELLKEAGYNQNASNSKEEMPKIYKEVSDENHSTHVQEEVFTEFMKDNENYDNDDNDGNDVNNDDSGGGDGENEEDETHLQFENLSAKNVMQNASISTEVSSNEKPGFKLFLCSVCGKSFTQSKSLAIHNRLHTGEKPYECNICGQKFNQKQALQRHYQTKQHTGTSPAKHYSCSICNKKLVSKYSLRIHKKRHFNGEECGIGFNTSKGFKLHRFNEHKEEVTDFKKCDMCNIPFVSVNDFNQHMIDVHDKIDKNCEVCEQHFTSQKLMEDHLLEHKVNVN